MVARVAETGARLLTALRDVTANAPRVGDVRGWGLAVALDIVDPATGRSDPDRSRWIVEGMKDRGVLIGRTGCAGSTLKIRPPLVFGDDHTDLLIEALQATLRDGR